MGRKDHRIKSLVTALDYEEKWRKQDKVASQATISAYRQMLNALQQDNARLQGKLQRRSRELGIQRAEVKKIDAMYQISQDHLGKCQEAYGRLAHQVDVLHRLARVHFSPDEIDRALDSDAGAFAVVRGLKDVPA